MSFESFGDFLAMGHHGPYVWSAYAISLAVLALNVVLPILGPSNLRDTGGLVSDFNGGHDFLEKGQIVAGNTKCFKAVLTAIQPHLAPSMKR